MISKENNKKNLKTRHRLFFVLFFTAIYMLAEIIGGVLTNSLALLADAGHMMGDFAALGMSVFATYMVEKPADADKTYGYYRAEILVALLNGLLLVGVALHILYEAVTRLFSPPEVQAPLMIGIAIGGLFINLIGLVALHSSAKDSLNIKGAFFHIIGDTLGSIGVIIAGLLIHFYQFYYADIITSFLIAILISITASKLIKESGNILLEGTPQHIDANKIKETLLSIDEVKKVHELHVWCISQNRISLSVHLSTNSLDSYDVLLKANWVLKEKFGIHHTTIQVEPIKFPKDHCDF